MIKNRKNRKGFTLIELLVVIAIIAILAVVVVLTLNPAELLRQARDSNRASDFATLKSALGLYAADVTTSTPMGSSTVVYSSTNTGSVIISTMNLSGATSSASWGYLTTETSIASSSLRGIGGVTGGPVVSWLPISFQSISSGAPIGAEPVDPVNSGGNFYTYAATSTAYKLATKMESQKYGNGGSNDIVSTDGGNSTTTYEQGTNITGF